eukprot:CAMPEP_0117436486 /NCGR_PEP_ID=MMETSP0759-20121206/1031_1 /TAXON_ID=63605 /ORGANISM="Percolomonas cosmopolitus, Strain WS" /LENGTH=1193 /DNA_ID=CAMNT_0005228085 /DNA_START=106 /DNA_END=3687 /DNA_ORIENTATION=+
MSEHSSPSSSQNDSSSEITSFLVEDDTTSKQINTLSSSPLSSSQLQKNHTSDQMKPSNEESSDESGNENENHESTAVELQNTSSSPHLNTFTDELPDPSQWPNTSKRSRFSLILGADNQSLENRRRKPYEATEEEIRAAADVGDDEIQKDAYLDEAKENDENMELLPPAHDHDETNKPSLVAVDEEVAMRIPVTESNEASDDAEDKMETGESEDEPEDRMTDDENEAPPLPADFSFATEANEENREGISATTTTTTVVEETSDGIHTHIEVSETVHTETNTTEPTSMQEAYTKDVTHLTEEGNSEEQQDDSTTVESRADFEDLIRDMPVSTEASTTEEHPENQDTEVESSNQGDQSSTTAQKAEESPNTTTSIPSNSPQHMFDVETPTPFVVEDGVTVASNPVRERTDSAQDNDSILNTTAASSTGTVEVVPSTEGFSFKEPGLDAAQKQLSEFQQLNQTESLSGATGVQFIATTDEECKPLATDASNLSTSIEERMDVKDVPSKAKISSPTISSIETTAQVLSTIQPTPSPTRAPDTLAPPAVSDDYGSPQFSSDENPFAEEAGALDVSVPPGEMKISTVSKEDQMEVEENDEMQVVEEGSEPPETTEITISDSGSDEEEEGESSASSQSRSEASERASASDESSSLDAEGSPLKQPLHFKFTSKKEQARYEDNSDSDVDDSESQSVSSEALSDVSEEDENRPKSVSQFATTVQDQTRNAVPPRKRFTMPSEKAVNHVSPAKSSSDKSSLSEEVRDLMDYLSQPQQKHAAPQKYTDSSEDDEDEDEDMSMEGSSDEEDLLDDDLAGFTQPARPSLPMQIGRRPTNYSYGVPNAAQESATVKSNEPIVLSSSSDEEEEEVTAATSSAIPEPPQQSSNSEFKKRYPSDVRTLRERFVPRPSTVSQRIYNRGVSDIPQVDVVSAPKPTFQAPLVPRVQPQQQQVTEHPEQQQSTFTSPISFQSPDTLPRTTPMRRREEASPFLQNESISTPRTVVKSSPLGLSRLTPSHNATPSFRPLSSRKRKPTFFDKVSRKLKASHEQQHRMTWKAGPEKPFASPQPSARRNTFSNPFSRFSSKNASVALTPRTSIGTPIRTPHPLTPFPSTNTVRSSILGKRSQMDTPSIARPAKRVRYGSSLMSEATMQPASNFLDVTPSRNLHRRDSLRSENPLLDSSLLNTPRFFSPTIAGNRRYLRR